MRRRSGRWAGRRGRLGDERRRGFVATLVIALVVGLVLAAVPFPVATSTAAAAGRASTRGLGISAFAGVAHGISGVADANIEVRSLRHADLDGDGLDDAIAVLSYANEHGDYWLVQAYRHLDGVMTPVGRTQEFYAKWEHLDRLTVVDSTIEFTVLHGEHNGGYLEVQRWAEADDQLRLLDRVAGGTVHVVRAGDTDVPTVEEWERTSFIDVAPGAGTRGIYLDVAEADALQVLSDRADARIRIYNLSTGLLLDEVRAGEMITMPHGGRWYGQVVADSDQWTRFKLTLADQRAVLAPQITRRMHHEGTNNETGTEPRRSVSLAWYELTWAHGAVDVERVNNVIRDFVDRIHDEHVAAAATCPEDTDATLFVDAAPELVSYDLVSFRFTVASCLCEANDEVVSHGLTIDLTTAKPLALDDLVNDEGALGAAWFDRSRWAHEAAETLDDVTVPDFSVVTLTPYGITVRDDAPDSFVTMLSFDDYPSVVRHELVRRARSGADVELPYQGCGC